MGKLWCASLPTIAVPRTDVPKHVTFVYPYYENARFFQQQLAHWHTYPAHLRAHVSAILVDDGSPVPAAMPANSPFPLRLFRIDVDIRWNWLAARNIGAHHAPQGWMLLTDMDHVVPEDTLRGIVYGQHDREVAYAFSRREHTGEAIGPHSASFLMTRGMFWNIGGYDETLSGHYGTDGLFRKQVAAYAPMHVLTDYLVRHEHVDDSSTTRYLRKQPEDAAVRALVERRKPGWRPKTLSFKYHEVVAGSLCQ